MTTSQIYWTIGNKASNTDAMTCRRSHPARSAGDVIIHGDVYPHSRLHEIWVVRSNYKRLCWFWNTCLWEIEALYASSLVLVLITVSLQCCLTVPIDPADNMGVRLFSHLSVYYWNRKSLWKKFLRQHGTQSPLQGITTYTNSVNLIEERWLD